jgi:hypothetical protein
MSDATVGRGKLGWVWRIAAGMALVGWLAVGARAQAPPACDATRWTGVPTFTGSVSVNANANATGTDGSSLQLSESAQSAPTLAAPANAPSYAWSGAMNGSVNFSLTTTDSLGQVTTTEGTGPSLTASGTPAQMYLSMDPSGCTYTIAFDTFVNAIVTNPSGNTSSLLTAWIGSSVDAQPLPASGTTLSGSYSYTDNSIPGAPIGVTISWSLAPGTPNLDLVVKIPDYGNWIPSAGATAKDVGLKTNGQKNFLPIQVVVQNKDGSASLAVPDQVELSLVNGSSEPGISMNWPASGSATSDPDLTFDVSQAVAGLPVPTLSQNDTVATFQNVTSPPLLFVSVAPHDWGGWATLNVTAMVGTQKLTGHLDGIPNITDILLPNRNDANSHIATAWLTARNIAQVDSWDGETSPSNSNDGDGLTLYEEYRGFTVQCPSPEAPAGPQCAGGVGHIYGDPNKKDLFVVVDPQLGSEVAPGILNFQAKAGLKVHYAGLTKDYLSSTNVINFNHSQGSHLVDQHGLQIKLWQMLMGCTAGGPGTPMDIQQINVPHLSSIVSAAQRLGQSASRIAVYRATYPRLISHEIGHGVDISHHGEIDPKEVTWSTSNGIDITETILRSSFTSTVTVYSENPVELLSPADLGITPTNPISLYVGITGGQHSGDTKCLMRYGSSSAYIDNSNLANRYLAQEQPDFDLTNVETGTGVNVGNWSPQPRYGDATPRGACQSQLCVSDFVHATPLQSHQPTCP